MRAKKLLSLIMTFMIILGSFTFGFSVPAGELTLTKTEEKVDGECDQWDITLTLEGVDGQETSDTVLVIDRSGSMGNDGKLSKAKTAAKSFVEMVFAGENSSNHRIAVVSFGSGVTEEIGFSSNESSIKAAIDGLSASGGTHTQAGVRKAGQLISGSSADIQSIVLLSDGRATYSYKIDGTIDYEYISGSFITDGYWTTSNQPGFDYNTRIGDGNRNSDDETPDGDDHYYRHGASAVQEAEGIKNGVKIYTVSVENDDEGDWTLENIASSGEFYRVNNPSTLTSIYEKIAAKILHAATNTVVTDPMGYYFDIPGINASNYNDHITVSTGTVSWNNDTETIEWTIGTLIGTPTMTYRVQMIPEGYGLGDLPTNKTTTVDYTDIEGDPASQNFPIPEVSDDCIIPGTLVIDKHVFGDLANGNDVFTFDIKDATGALVDTVTASGINSASISLLPGDYTVEETEFNGYVPDYTSTSAAVAEGQTVTVDFNNTKETPPPVPGLLLIDKHVDGDKASQSDVFTFEVKLPTGELVETVTASGIQDGSLELLAGAYVVEETGYMSYTPEYTTTSAAIVAEGTTKVHFYNNWETQPGKLVIDKSVTGDLADENDVFTFVVKMYGDPVETVTASALNNGQVELMPGTYLVEETVYGEYEPSYTTQQAVITEEGTTTVRFTNDKSTKYGNVIVHKAFSEGSITTSMAFEYKIGTSDEIDEFSEAVVDSSVAYGTPDGPYQLPVGTYYIGERPYDGWMEIGIQQFAVVEGQTTHVAMTNTAIEDGMLIVHKDVPNVENDYHEFMFTIKKHIGEDQYELITSAAITEDEVIILEGLEYGDYIIEETDDDLRYIHHKESETVTLSAANPSDEVTFTNTMRVAELTLEKTVDYDVVYVGDKVTYSVLITNTGTQDLGFMFEDYDGYDIAITPTAMYLYVDESMQFDIFTTYDTTGYKANIAYVTYMDNFGEFHTITDSALVNVIDEPMYSLEIDKTVDDNRVKRNEEVTYTVVLHNNSNVSIWVDYFDTDGYDITITDTAMQFEMGPNTTAGPFYYTTSYSSTGDYENVATATYYEHIEAYEPLGTVSDSALVEVYKDSTTSKRYKMTIDKEADDNDVMVGDTITYIITVENTGNQTLTNVLVTDPLLGFEETIEKLYEDDVVTFTVEYLAEEAGVIDNVAYAEDDKAPDVEDDETVVVNDEPSRDVPGLAIDKSISSDKKADFEPGEMAEFKLVVTNTGETDLVNVLVEDNLGGYYDPFTVTIAELKEGESEEIFVSMYIPNGADDFLNVATATSGDLKATDDELVTIAEEEIELLDVEDQTPLAVPDAGPTPMFLIYGLAALGSGLGFSLRKRR